jgi:GxxExxY protein
MLFEKELTELILKSAFQVHTVLGPGLLESAYEDCLIYKLRKSGLFVEKQKLIPLTFEMVEIQAGYRADLVVDNKVIIELKSIECLNDVHTAQILTYLKLSGCKVGLLINFNVKSLKDGIRRYVK